MKRRQKKSQLTPADEVLQAVFQNSTSPLRDGFQRWRLEQQWTDIVGENIGNHSRPVMFDKGTLLVEVASSAWANELQYFKFDIIKKVNKYVGGTYWVKKVRFIQKGFSKSNESNESKY